jgi:hypothetical protein
MKSQSVSILSILLLVMLAAVTLADSKANALPQNASALPAAAAVVKARTYVSLDPVPRGSEFQAAIVVDVARGFHMNSHKPTEAYLIPTTLTVEPPAEIQLLDTIYPGGKLEKFSFSPDAALDVYTGSVTLRLRLVAGAGAPLGATTVPATLRYQACNQTACLPPVKVPVQIPFYVAQAGSTTRAAHPEIFAASGSSEQK